MINDVPVGTIPGNELVQDVRARRHTPFAGPAARNVEGALADSGEDVVIAAARQAPGAPVPAVLPRLLCGELTIERIVRCCPQRAVRTAAHAAGSSG